MFLLKMFNNDLRYFDAYVVCTQYFSNYDIFKPCAVVPSQMCHRHPVPFLNISINPSSYNVVPSPLA